MKKTIGFIAVAIALMSFGFQKMEFKIKGSDTVLPLSQKEVENYGNKNKDAKISVIGGGSGVGIAALIDGTTDIAMASRKMKIAEKQKLVDAKKDLKEITIAWDALAVIVNPKNKVKELTREQLEGIFTGKTTNWKEVGGDDMAIVTYSRESSSGTYEFFKEHILENKNYGTGVLTMPATGAIVQSVSQTAGAIGYIGLAYLSKDVRGLAVAMKKGDKFVAPSMKTAKDKTYPVIRPLFYYYIATSEKLVKPYIDYVLSKEGQKTVEEVGYVPVK